MALTKAQLEKRKQQLAENKKNEEQMYKNLLGLTDNHDNVEPVTDSSLPKDNAATSTIIEDNITDKIPNNATESHKTSEKTNPSKNKSNSRYPGTKTKKYLLTTYPELFEELTNISLTKSIETGHVVSVGNLINDILTDYIDKYFKEKGESH